VKLAKESRRNFERACATYHIGGAINIRRELIRHSESVVEQFGQLTSQCATLGAAVEYYEKCCVLLKQW
jgi:hypothetical protein